MHVFFSGIGGTGIGPLALIAHQAGYTVSGSDKQMSGYITYLHKKGIQNITIGQSTDQITAVHDKTPIDWIVYSSAVPKEQPSHPELVFARDHAIKATKRDEFIVQFLEETDQKMIAIAGTHGKTTTTAMTIWAFKELGIPVSYSVGGKTSFADMGAFDKDAEYFVYEADEYDRNFLSFHPALSIIPGIAYDHADVYPTQESYNQAFRDFVCQSSDIVARTADLERIGLAINPEKPEMSEVTSLLTLPGKVNRENAKLVIEAMQQLFHAPLHDLVGIMNRFPGVYRRFERIVDGVYSDYAHTPEKIAGALQTAREVAGDNVVVVYEGLHNTRQHFIKNQLETLFDCIKKLYIVPSYLAREDESLEILTPEKLCQITQKPAEREPAELNEELKKVITTHTLAGDLVLCLTAGGGGSLDEWLRREFKS